LSEPRWLSGEDLERPQGVAEDAVVRVLRVPPEAAGTRLDVFLSAHLRNTSRSRAKLIVEHSAFSPDGRPRRASERVRAEERIVLWRPPVDDELPDLVLPVVYEDEHLSVINKPANITVHPTARHYHATVMKTLEKQRPGEFFALIHRLDKETGGVLMLARSPAADRAFKQLLEGHVLSEVREARRATEATPRKQRVRNVDKTYLAITWGIPEEGLIDAPLEQDPDNPLRVKMHVPKSGGLDARTHVTVLDRVTRASDGRSYALLRCKLFTGRQHQIRVHLAHIGTPVVGDKLYGPDERMLARSADGELTEEDLRRLELPRHALHAESYQLEHAITGAPLELLAPLPEDLVEFWSTLGGGPPNLVSSG
jgi:23S rRNA pseudouridine1911/1915/1917 synthase